MDYSTLQSRVQSAVGRTDVPSYVYELATADINRAVRLFEMEASATLSATAETVTLPTGFLQVKNIYVDRSPRVALRPATDQALNVRHDSSGVPTYYAIENGQLRLMPVPDGTYSIELTYYAKVGDLSADADTNDVMSEYPGLYLYAALRHAAVWAQDAELASTYNMAFETEVNACKKSEKLSKYVGPMVSRSGSTGY